MLHSSRYLVTPSETESTDAAGDAGAPALSVFLITLNEADRLGAALESVSGLASEVIVVDAGSSDGTVELALSHGARVIHREWTGYGDQKRHAESLCANDWVLNLDADERLTPEARAEIAQRLADDRDVAAWRLPIRLRFPFEATPRRFVHGHAPVRLYRRSAARFSAHPTHDRVEISTDCRVGRLRGVAIHDSQRSLAHAVEKMNRYTDALARAAGPAAPSILGLAAEPLWSFFKAFILRRYFLYGRWGLALSWLYAQSRLLKRAKRFEAYLAEQSRTG
jgi:glycosyltransferase involved in cell wall biosynthesis